MNDDATLSGLRVLVIEDNFLAAMSMKSILERLCCEVVGPVATVEDGERAVGQESVDVGILDVNLFGGTSAAIAEALRDHHRPVVFVTGYSSPAMLPPSFANAPTLKKPVDDQSVRRALLAAIAR